MLEMLADGFHREKQSFGLAAEASEAELQIEIRRPGVQRVHEKYARSNDLGCLQCAAHRIADQILTETAPLLGFVDGEHSQNDDGNRIKAIAPERTRRFASSDAAR